MPSNTTRLLRLATVVVLLLVAVNHRSLIAPIPEVDDRQVSNRPPVDQRPDDHTPAPPKHTAATPRPHPVTDPVDDPATTAAPAPPSPTAMAMRRATTTAPPAVAAADTANTNAKGEAQPEPQNEIPRVIYISWKSHKLPEKAQSIQEQWLKAEPSYEHKLITDDDCRAYASRFPHLRARYDALPMNVMRADICRLLVVYYEGGIYHDLDVSPVEPFSKWFDHKLDVVYGNEDEHMCQWFFAAKRGNKCIRSVIDYVNGKIANMTLDFNKNPEAVIDITGPGAFTNGMKDCPTKQSMSVEDVRERKVRHHFAAMNWGKGYDSWLSERQKIAGWKDMWPNRNRFADYFFDSSAQLLGERSDAAIVPVGVRQSNHRFGEFFKFYPATHAVDGDLDSFIMTENGKNEFFELQLQRTLSLVRAEDRAHANADHLTCVKIFNKRRMHDQEHFSGKMLTVRDAHGATLAEFGPFGEAVPSYTFLINGTGIASSLRVWKKDGTVMFSEIQLFSDADCRHARRLNVEWQDRTDAPHELGGHDRAIIEFATTLRRITRRCGHIRALSWEPNFEFSLCYDRPLTPAFLSSPGKCLALSFVDDEVDEPFVATIGSQGNASCAVVGVVAHKPKDPPSRLKIPIQYATLHPRAATDIPSNGVTIESTIKSLAKDGVAPHVAVVHVDVSGRTPWRLVPDLTRLAETKSADHVLLTLRLDQLDDRTMPRQEATAALVDFLTAITASYDLYAWHITPRSEIVVRGRDLPCCFQLSLMRKGL